MPKHDSFKKPRKNKMGETPSILAYTLALLFLIIIAAIVLLFSLAS